MNTFFIPSCHAFIIKFLCLLREFDMMRKLNAFVALQQMGWVITLQNG